MDLAGEAVSIGVETGAVLAVDGYGSGGLLRVRGVSSYLSDGCHLCLPSERSPWGRATDPAIAWRFTAAWVEKLYRAERKGDDLFSECVIVNWAMVENNGARLFSGSDAVAYRLYPVRG